MDQDHIIQELKSIGNNIKKLREFKGYTREVIADELNLTVSGYGKIESGEVEFSVKKVFEIANILNTDAINLMKLNSSDMFKIPDPLDLSKYEYKAENHTTVLRDSNQVLYLKLLEKRIETIENKIEKLEKQVQG